VTPVSTPSPIAANGALTIQFSGWTPWAVTLLPSANAVWIGANGTYNGANGLAWFLSQNRDEPTFAQYDAAVGSLSLNPDIANWDANTTYNLSMYINGVSGMGIYWNSGWYTTTTGAGTGYRSAKQDNLYLGGATATSGGDIWTWGYKIYNRVKR